MATIDPDLERAARGDRQAAERVLHPVLPRIRNLVRYLCRGDAEVDDISQLALIAVLKGLGSYRGEGAFVSWVDRITARETLRFLKRARAEAGLRARVELTALPSPSHADAFLHRREVAQLLDALPEAQREVVVLHHAVGMSTPEIARMLELPFDTVKSRLRLGMKRMRARSEPESPQRGAVIE